MAAEVGVDADLDAPVDIGSMDVEFDSDGTAHAAGESHAEDSEQFMGCLERAALFPQQSEPE